MNILKNLFRELLKALSGGFEKEQKTLLQKTFQNPVALTADDVGKYFRILSVEGKKMKVIQCEYWRTVYKNTENFYQFTKTGTGDQTLKDRYVTLSDIGFEYYVTGIHTNSIGIMKIEIEDGMLIGRPCQNCIHENDLNFRVSKVPISELLFHFS